MMHTFSRKLTALGLAGVLVVGLAGCETSDRGQKETAGTILGGIGGAVAGAQFGRGSGRLVGVAAGTLLGAFIGSEIGKSLDRADMTHMERTNQQALERNRVGQASTWRNPDSGHGGSITPTRTYESAGAPCREYQQTITVGGRSEQGYGTACRQPDGSWKVVN